MNSSIRTAADQDTSTVVIIVMIVVIVVAVAVAVAVVVNAVVQAVVVAVGIAESDPKLGTMRTISIKQVFQQSVLR